MADLRKTDFERIAGIMADLRGAVEALTGPAAPVALSRAFESAALDLAKALAPHNGKFNQARFLSACRPNAAKGNS